MTTIDRLIHAADELETRIEGDPDGAAFVGLLRDAARTILELQHVRQQIAEDLAARIADGALRVITTAQGRFVEGEAEVPWEFGGLTGKLLLHPDGDPADRYTTKMGGAEFAAMFAAAHQNGAAMAAHTMLKFGKELDALQNPPAEEG